jgi:50S ribosomal subunit-associated GTPase HflX
VLIHLLDAANPRWEQQLESVEKILTELDLNHIPRLVVFNKADLVEPELLDAILRQTCATGARRCVAVSAPDPRTLRPMLEAVGSILARDLTTHPGAHDNDEDNEESESPDEARAGSHAAEQAAAADVKVEETKADAVETSRPEDEIHEADAEDLEYAARIAR